MAEIDVRQWRLLGAGNEVVPGRGYTLRNTRERESVRYGKRKWGINLVWDSSTDLRNVVLERGDGSAGAIRYGEPIALRVTGGGQYIRYQRRDNGINLVWSSRRVADWELVGGSAGTVVRPNRTLSLFNRRHGDHLVYGSRPRGINLRWWSDLRLKTEPNTGRMFSTLFGPYLPLPLPALMRGPSGEPGQIELSGIVEKVSIFHGGVDDELDWHIFMRPSIADTRRLGRHLTQHANFGRFSFDPASLQRFVCEWMVLDGWDNSRFDEKFYSADVRRALELDSSAWVISEVAAEKQNISGASVDATNRSAIAGARVSLQGPLVNDAGHGFKVEIHPLDSVAYALVGGVPLSVGAGQRGWPSTSVTWRVAAFTNSDFHRINRADYLKKRRTIRWYLPLPDNARRGAARTTVTASFPRFVNESVDRSGLDDRRPTGATYADHGVVRHSNRIAVDPRDGERKLRVDVVMREPTDRWGGMFLGEYTLRSFPVATQPGTGTLSTGTLSTGSTGPRPRQRPRRSTTSMRTARPRSTARPRPGRRP